MFLRDGKAFPIGEPFVDEDGTQYPAGFFLGLSAEERAAFGITEGSQQLRPDDEMFFVHDNGDGTYSAVERPFERLQDLWRQKITVRRKRAEEGGVSIGGASIRTDESSLIKINGAVNLVINDPTVLSIDFEAQPGVWVELDRNTMMTIGIATGRHVQACFSKSKALQAEVAAANSLADLQAIDIESGWPS